MKIVVIGASGLLGSSLVPYLENFDNKVITAGRSKSNCNEIDILNKTNVNSFLSTTNPDVIINLVALTDVDFCEKYPQTAFQVNALSSKNISNWIKKNKKNTRFIHISTDHLYDGIGPHNEENITLKNYYAYSKYLGELFANTNNSIILRTNFFGRSLCENRRGFTDWIFDNLINEKEFNVFKDVFFSPLSISTLCKYIYKLMRSDVCGVYNLGSNEGMSKSDFAFMFANNLNLNNKYMKSVSISECDFIKTYRPYDMRLNVDKIESTMLLSLPNLRDEILLSCKEYSKL